jgi:hypothetical protein
MDVMVDAIWNVELRSNSAFREVDQRVEACND